MSDNDFDIRQSKSEGRCRSNRWVEVFRPRPDARVQLCCFHHAGGSANSFRSWTPYIPPWVEICGIALPGRSARLDEPPYTIIEHLVADIVGSTGQSFRKPFVFFGHSMGALIAFELARALPKAGLPEPTALIVSGCLPPHLERPARNLTMMSDSEFLDYLYSLEGTPRELFQNRAALELFLPVLRADFELVDSYRFRPGRLSCGVAACAGASDRQADPKALSGWSHMTSGPFQPRVFPGSHFYLQSQLQPLLRWMLETISEWTDRTHD